MSEEAPGTVLVEAGHGEYTLGPLTIEDVDALSGRELDAAVAWYVMGWDVVRTNGVAWYGRYPGCKFSTEDVPNYSNDMTSMWQALAHMELKGWLFSLMNGYSRRGNKEVDWRCDLWRDPDNNGHRQPHKYAYGWDAPEAIGRALVKVVLASQPLSRPGDCRVGSYAHGQSVIL